MRILSLNTWHGERKDELRKFLSSEFEATDIFCFQETNGENIEKILAELFDTPLLSLAHATKTTDTDRHYSLHTFAKKPFEIMDSKELFSDEDAETGQALATTIRVDDGPLIAIVNIHGVPFITDDKLDTEGRLRQTDMIISWLESTGAPAVVCGDFNLLPEAESVKKFARAGYQDLITNYSIPTTRNRLAWERFPGNEQYFADYTFVSPELSVAGFSVPNVDASDHLPMIVRLRR